MCVVGVRIQTFRTWDRARDTSAPHGQSATKVYYCFLTLMRTCLICSLKILEAAVIGAPDVIAGQLVVALVTIREGASHHLISDSLLLFLEVVALIYTMDTALRFDSLIQDRLAKYKRPRRIIVVPALPRNQLGKVCVCARIIQNSKVISNITSYKRSIRKRSSKTWTYLCDLYRCT